MQAVNETYTASSGRLAGQCVTYVAKVFAWLLWSFMVALAGTASLSLCLMMHKCLSSCVCSYLYVCLSVLMFANNRFSAKLSRGRCVWSCVFRTGLRREFACIRSSIVAYERRVLSFRVT